VTSRLVAVARAAVTSGSAAPASSGKSSRRTCGRNENEWSTTTSICSGESRIRANQCFHGEPLSTGFVARSESDNECGKT